jgi:hypothetical protein
VGVVQGDQQGPHGHFPQPVEDGVEAIGRRVVDASASGSSYQDFGAQQGLEGLAEQAEGQCRLGHVGPADPDGQTIPGQGDGVVQQSGLAEPGLSQDEEGPAPTGHGVIQQLP